MFDDKKIVIQLGKVLNRRLDDLLNNLDKGDFYTTVNSKCINDIHEVYSNVENSDIGDSQKRSLTNKLRKLLNHIMIFLLKNQKISSFSDYYGNIMLAVNRLVSDVRYYDAIMLNDSSNKKS